ncbi:uncharacterized protein C01G6.5-like [Ylistrum balloti]|uniref:uncharacterized protein C01G6.5-like n=1 Tax=Ylistrum balloti TaxID=509963 RepID=UPI0029059E37|nr:uncharacterized protein C01G6.5-like [Ylistrum balloti]
MSMGMDAEQQEEECWYQLRRVGHTATLPKVRDVMKLHVGVTKFGRAASNHYYLDSATLPNFISRHHSEIHGIRDEDGLIKFVLHDKGLNGTFINDIKMQSSCELEEGDKITFGHTNGYKLAPGQHSRQPHSEFQFIFEKVYRSNENIVNNGVKQEKENSTLSDTEKRKRICARDNAVDIETFKERWSRNNSNSKTESDSDKTSATRIKTIENVSQDNDSCSSSSSSSSSSSASSGSSSSSSSSSSSVRSSSKSPNSHTADHAADTDTPSFNISQNRHENSTIIMSEPNSDKDESDENDNENDNVSEQSSQSLHKVDNDSDDSEQSDSNSGDNSDDDASNNEDEDDKFKSDSENDNESDTEMKEDNENQKDSSEEEDEEEEPKEIEQLPSPVPVKRKSRAPKKGAKTKRMKLAMPSRRGRQSRKMLKRNSKSSDFNDNDDLPSLNGGSSHDSMMNEDKAESHRDPYLFASEESSDDETNTRLKAIIHKIGKIGTRPTTGKKRQKKTMKKKTQQRKPLIPPPPPPKSAARKRKAPPAPVAATSGRGRGKKAKPTPGRGRRRRGHSSESSDPEEEELEDNLEEGVEWYEVETCDADDCKRPSDKTVAWVQCDYCDKWFHTQCVNCKYEHVNDPDIKFNCGCS